MLARLAAVAVGLVARNAGAATLSLRLDYLPDVFLDGEALRVSRGDAGPEALLSLPNKGWAELKLVYRYGSDGTPLNSPGPTVERYQVYLDEKLHLIVEPEMNVVAETPAPGDRCISFDAPPKGSTWSACADFEKGIPAGRVFRLDRCPQLVGQTGLIRFQLKFASGELRGSPWIVDSRPGLYSVRWADGAIRVSFDPKARCEHGPKWSALPLK